MYQSFLCGGQNPPHVKCWSNDWTTQPPSWTVLILKKSWWQDYLLEHVQMMNFQPKKSAAPFIFTSSCVTRSENSLETWITPKSIVFIFTQSRYGMITILQGSAKFPNRKQWGILLEFSIGCSPITSKLESWKLTKALNTCFVLFMTPQQLYN